VNRSSVKIDVETHLAGRTLYWLAKSSGVPYSTLHKIARNKTDGISFAVLEKLCDALACEPCDLIIRKPTQMHVKEDLR
jgi:DNA-binding Xre family transcriptional regulator